MRLAAVVASIALGGAVAQASSAEVFLMNIPGVSGDVTLAGYPGWISVTTFSEGFASIGGASAGGGARHVTCHDLRIVKPLDVTSPALTMAVATGHQYSKIELVALSNSHGSESPFLKLTLHHAFITAVNLGGDSATSARYETLTVEAQSIDVSYFAPRPDGAPGEMTATVECAVR